MKGDGDEAEEENSTEAISDCTCAPGLLRRSSQWGWRLCSGILAARSLPGIPGLVLWWVSQGNRNESTRMRRWEQTHLPFCVSQQVPNPPPTQHLLPVPNAGEHATYPHHGRDPTRARARTSGWHVATGPISRSHLALTTNSPKDKLPGYIDHRLGRSAPQHHRQRCHLQHPGHQEAGLLGRQVPAG